MPNSYAKEIIKKSSDEWLDKSYLIYSLYTIQHRALVANDGLKPITRRFLFSMWKNGGAKSNADHLKGVRAVAAVMAYHPHGDESISDSVPKLGQKFNMRVPLIDVQGNVGYMTGDDPAAPRYWEAKLSKAGIELVKELDDHAVPMGKSFDRKLDEAHLLPVRFPNHIVNGTEGITVGYTSSIPTHNPSEVLDASIALIKNKGEMTTEQIMEVMPGPDYPTGGIIVENESIKDYFENGKGTVRLRGRYYEEKLPKGATRFVFYELPYKVSPAKVKSQIISAQNKGKLQDIATFEDYSDRNNGLNFEIETRPGANAISVMNEILKETSIEQTLTVQTTVLQHNRPYLSSMKDMLMNFVSLRNFCNVNKAEFNLDRLTKRDNQLQGLLKVLLDIDKAIEIIRGSDDQKEAQDKLMSHFKIDEDQADYILSMPLRRLTKADSSSVKSDSDKVNEEIKYCKRLLEDRDFMDQHIIDELEETKTVIGDERRTEIIERTRDDFKNGVAVETKRIKAASRGEAPSYINYLSNGTFTRTPEDEKIETPVLYRLKVAEKADIVAVTEDGIGHKIPASYVSDDSEANSLLFGDKRVVGFSKYEMLAGDGGLLIGTDHGAVKLAKTDFGKNDEFPVIGLNDGESVVSCYWLTSEKENYDVMLSASNGNILLFPADQLRLSGSRAKGIAGMKLKDDAQIAGFGVIPHDDEEYQIISYTGHSIKSTLKNEISIKSRGGMGVMLHRIGKSENGLIITVPTINPIATDSNGTPILTPAPSKRGNSGSTIDINGIVIGDTPGSDMDDE